METFEVGTEVVILDGTSLTGVVLDSDYTPDVGALFATYKVSVNGSDGRWYRADELAPAPAVASAAGDGATATEIEQSAVIDHVSSELVMLQMAVAEGLGLHRHALLDVDRDDIAEMVASLRAALEPFATIYERWTNRLLVDQYFPEWLEIHLTVREQEGWYTRQWFEEAAKALQASAPPADGEGGE